MTRIAIFQRGALSSISERLADRCLCEVATLEGSRRIATQGASARHRSRRRLLLLSISFVKCQESALLRLLESDLAQTDETSQNITDLLLRGSDVLPGYLGHRADVGTNASRLVGAVHAIDALRQLFVGTLKG